MKEHKHAEVLRAIADGIEVGFYGVDDKTWIPSSEHRNPISDPQYEWRVKPAPKPDEIFYYGISKDKSKASVSFHYDGGPYDYGWETTIKVTWDGETNEPKSVELVK